MAASSPPRTALRSGIQGAEHPDDRAARQRDRAERADARMTQQSARSQGSRLVRAGISSCRSASSARERSRSIARAGEAGWSAGRAETCRRRGGTRIRRAYWEAANDRRAAEYRRGQAKPGQQRRWRRAFASCDRNDRRVAGRCRMVQPIAAGQRTRRRLAQQDDSQIRYSGLQNRPCDSGLRVRCPAAIDSTRRCAACSILREVIQRLVHAAALCRQLHEDVVREARRADAEQVGREPVLTERLAQERPGTEARPWRC